MALSGATASICTPPNLPASVTASRIKTLTSDIRHRLRTAIETIESSSVNTGWDTTFAPLSLALGDASASSASVTLPSMSHPDADVRAASTHAKDELKRMFDDAFARRDLYVSLSSALESDNSVEGRRSDVDQRMASLLLGRFRRNGCGLSNISDREELASKRSELEEKCSAFCSAINENTDTLVFTEEELEGLPDVTQFPLLEEEEEAGSASSDGGPSADVPPTRRRKVSLKTPHTVPVLQFAKKSSTRRAVVVALAKKCQDENTPRFLDAIKLRQECAELLGYESHAHFMIEASMASSPDRVNDFLAMLLDRLKVQRDADIRTLLNLKEQEEGPHCGPLQPWDVQYYVRVHKSTLGVDEALLRNYFPLEHVKKQILSIYEELLGVTFRRVEDAEVWHPDVECYAVGVADDTTNGGGYGSRTDDNGALGHFYLDLFPRDGKYSHQCVYPLRPSYVDAHGRRVLPACANIGNLSRGTDGKPSLLRFREVETFFHEFGHVMHCVLSKSEHSLQAWSWSAVPWPGGVEHDFLEVPSMMLENFVWQPEILRRLSIRFDDGSALPDEQISALCASRFAMKGLLQSRYLAMAQYDLAVHSGRGPYSYKGQSYDAETLYDAMMSDIGGVPIIPGTFSVSSWFHPMMGYDAGYYSYIWSEAFAADLFSVFEGVDSVMDRSLGVKYRDTILSPCAMMGGDTMLKNFLGREPSLESFLRRIKTP